MPRTARLVLPEVPLHVVHRGHNRAACFFRPLDYRHYLRYLKLLMKQVAQCYTQTVNKSHARSGTLWEGRFRSCVVPTELYILTCYRYIELNPVRAGMVQTPQDYAWSSFSGNCAVEDDGLLSPHPVLKNLGSAAYRTLFDAPLEHSLVEEIRHATRTGGRLGTPRKRRGRQRRG